MWIVTQYKGHFEKETGEKITCNEIAGIFDSEEKAVEACRDWTYCVAPIELNKVFPHETVEIEGAYYPIKR